MNRNIKKKAHRGGFALFLAVILTLGSILSPEALGGQPLAVQAAEPIEAPVTSFSMEGESDDAGSPGLPLVEEDEADFALYTPPELPPQSVVQTRAAASYVPLPATYNLERAYQTSVKNQGNTSLCWAYSSMAAIEASTLKSTGVELNLSENHLAHAMSNYGNNTAGQNRIPSAGGSPSMTISYMLRGKINGAVLETDDPLPDAPASIPARSMAVTAAIQPSYHVPNGYVITNTSITDLNKQQTVKQAIMDFGAVTASIYSTSADNWDWTYDSYYNRSVGRSNHVVTIIGWDDNFSRTKFKYTAPGDGAWLVKNSYGSTFGDGGYFWLSYYDRMATQYCFAFDPVQPFDPDATIYEYDLQGYNAYFDSATYGANVFTANDPTEVLTAVRIYAPVMGDNLRIYFVPDYTSQADLDTSLLTPIVTYRVNKGGYLTIPVPIEHQAAVGNRFAIIVNYPSGYAPFCNGYGNTGNSFYVSKFTGKWAATNTPGFGGDTLCIKAVTNSAPNATYAITAQGASAFGELALGYTQPVAYQITITNSGTAVVNLTQPTAVNYDIGALSALSLAPQETATFTIQPLPGLAVGDYRESIIIQGDNGAFASIEAEFEVISPFLIAEGPQILKPKELQFNWPVFPYTPPAAQSVKVTYHGLGTITLEQPLSEYYDISMPNPATLNSGQSATFTVQPKAGFSLGNYDEEIAITATNGVATSILAQFGVSAGMGTWTQIVLQGSADFGELPVGYAQPAPLTIKLTTVGMSPPKVTQPTAVNFTIGSLTPSTFTTTLGYMTFTVQPPPDLPAGIYDETIPILTGSGSVSATLDIKFTVTDTANLITASELTSFGTMAVGYSTPPAQNVTVTNNGTGTVTLAQPEAEDYILGALSPSATLAPGASATFSVQPKPGLPIEDYKETIIIDGDNGASATVVAEFTVTAAETYSIMATSMMPFGTEAPGYTPPAAQTVTITNSGTGMIALSQPMATNYEIGTLSSGYLAPGDEAQFTVQPIGGLPAGNYNETITINGSNGVTASVNAEFTVSAAPMTYSISATGLTSFGSLTEGYTPPAVQTVTITNTGTGAVTLLQPTATNYTVSALSATNLAANASAQFTVQPIGGLLAGNYNETITINGSNGVTASVNAEFTVSAAPMTYSISATGLTSFGSLTEGYTPPAVQTVTITNTGTGAVTLLQPTATNYTVSALSATNLAANASAQFTVQPIGGLLAGNYNETITINGSNGVTASVNAEFTVSAAPMTYSISATGLTSFGSLTEGYTPPAVQTVTITNTGTGAVTLLQPTATNYTVSALSATNLAANASAQFTVQPIGGLLAGNYNETITINGSNGVTASVNAEFTVSAAPMTYSISATGLTSFGSLTEGYTPPAVQTVTITNTGTGAVTLLQPTATNYTVSALSATNLAANASAQFTVQPIGGLLAGNYNETIIINGSNGVTASVNAEFTVSAAPMTYSISATGLTSFGSLTEGYTPPAVQTVTITNTGTGAVTLLQPTATNYTVSALSATNLAANASAQFTVQPIGGLLAGNYNETIIINGSNGVTASVNAEFTVAVPLKYTIFVPANLASPQTLTFDLRDLPLNQINMATAALTLTGNSTGNVIETPYPILGTVLSYTVKDLVSAGVQDSYTLIIKTLDQEIHMVIIFEATNRKILNLHLETANITYNKQPYPLDKSILEAVHGGVPVSNFNPLVYTWSGFLRDGTPYNSSVPPIQAGSYQLEIKTDPSDLEYMGKNIFTIVILPRELTLKADNKTILPGEGIPVLTYTVTGIADNESVTDALTVEPTLTPAVTNTTTSGTFDILISGGAPTSNYIIVSRYNGILAINGGQGSGSGSGGGGGSSSSSRTTSTVTIQCVDEEGKVISSRNTTGTIGSSISLRAPTFEGYGLLSDNEIIYIVQSGSNTVTFRYKNLDTEELAQGTLEQTQSLIHAAYINGYPDGTFRADSPMKRAEAAAMLYNLIDNSASAASYTPDFTDVEPGAWYYISVMELSQRGIINGYPGGSYGAGNSITRAEFITLALKFAGIEPIANKSSFSDVDSNFWAAGYIQAAAEHNFLSGYPDGLFKPDSPITRAEVVSILNRITGRTDCNIREGKNFNDLNNSHWAYQMIMNAATEHTHN